MSPPLTGRRRRTPAAPGALAVAGWLA